MKRSALAAALCALVISSPAEAAPMHGFSDDPRAFEQNGSEALAAGATANRVVVGWREQPSDLAPAVAAMGGATPIISLNTIRADTPPDAYAASCARFAEAYPQAIIGTLNEPNIPLGGSQSIAAAVAQVNACADAVHAVHPAQVVLGAAVAPVNMTDAAAFISDMVPYLNGENASWHDYFDRVYSQTPDVAVDMHLYPYGEDKLKKLAVEVRYGRRYGPVYVTEVAALGEMGPRKRAKLTGRLSAKLDSLHVAAAMFFRLGAVRPDWLGWRSEAISAAGDRTRIFKELRKTWRSQKSRALAHAVVTGTDA